MLALDGGVVRGMISIKFLENIEDILRRRHARFQKLDVPNEIPAYIRLGAAAAKREMDRSEYPRASGLRIVRAGEGRLTAPHRAVNKPRLPKMRHRPSKAGAPKAAAKYMTLLRQRNRLKG